MFEKAKGLKICKKILKKNFGARGFLLIDEKMYLVSECFFLIHTTRNL